MNKRQYILQIAGECFAQEGIEKTTLESISEKAGVSKGGLFHYFASKQQLVEELAKLENMRLEQLFNQLHTWPNAYEAIEELMQTMLYVAADAIEGPLALALAIYANRNNKMDEIAKASEDYALQAVSCLVAKAKTEGQIHPNWSVLSASKWLLTIIDGLFVRLAVDNEFLPLAHIDELLHICQAFLRADPLPSQVQEKGALWCC